MTSRRYSSWWRLVPSSCSAPPNSPHWTPALTISDRSPKASISIEVDRAAGVVLAAVLLREAEADPAGVGQLLGRAGDPLAGLLHGLAVDRQEVGVVQVLAGVAAHVRPAAVQDLLERLRVDRGGAGGGHCLLLAGRGCGGHDAGQAGPGEIGQVCGEFGAEHGALGAQPPVGGRADQPDEAVAPGRRRRAGSRPALLEGQADDRAAACSPTRSERLSIGSRSAGRSSDLLVDDEPVELGVGLEERQVGLDRRGDHLAGAGRCSRSPSAASAAAATATRPQTAT